MNIARNASQKQIDTFFGKQHGAFDAERLQQAQHGGLQRWQVFKRHELIGCNIQNLHHGAIVGKGRVAPTLKWFACLSI